MPCYDPLPAWMSKEKTALGKRAVTFLKNDAYIDRTITLRCGQCLGCRMDKAREWALRCSHEAQLWPSNLFVTLTYDDDHIPTQNGVPTLRPTDFVKFMKRLRKSKPDQRIRFFQCGEYGDRTLRPHHHALLFNLSFPDLQRCRKRGDYPLYQSQELETLWKQGRAEIGEVNFTTAAYVARYTCKKGQQPKGSVPEYLTMSRKPGIGKLWLEKYIADVYPSDQCVTTSGTVNRPPRYYDQQLEKNHPDMLQKIRSERFLQLHNYTLKEDAPKRLSAKEKIQRTNLTLKGR